MPAQCFLTGSFAVMYKIESLFDLTREFSVPWLGYSILKVYDLPFDSIQCFWRFDLTKFAILLPRNAL